jgi:PKD repeat protein
MVGAATTPFVSFVPTPASGPAPLKVSFRTDVALPSPPTTWTIVWGDGTTRDGAGVVPHFTGHTFSEDGTYAVLLVLNAAGGRTYGSTVTITAGSGGGGGGGGGGSIVEVRLAADPEGRTAFQLAHVATVPPQQWDEYGPGAVGVGWDGALLGLGLHLRGGHVDDPEAWGRSAQGRQFLTASSEAWGRAYLAAGATPEQVATATANTTRFYAPDPNG